MGLDEFLWAERQQESGGDYRSVNSGSGALGAYQVMPYHLAASDWAGEVLGHGVSASEFLDSPPEQDAIARRILGGYYNEYGPRGAASAWYSGDPKLSESTKPQPGGPSIKGYVDEVIALMARAPGGSGGDPGSATPASTGTTVRTAGLQQAGYDAVIQLTPWGIPLNPFKLPGWLGGKLGDLAGGAGSAATKGLADSIGPVLLATVGIALGAGLVLLGAYVAAKPEIDSGLDQANKIASIS